MPNTPTDLFLFVKPEHSQQITEISWVTKTPNLYIMHLDDSDEASWKIPEWVRPEKVDNTNVGFNYVWSAGFSNEYRLMGHWRLGFSFPFAKELGYKYMLQVSGRDSRCPGIGMVVYSPRPVCTPYHRAIQTLTS